jgi:hypothetical protein
MKTPNSYRVRKGHLATSDSEGNNGVFIIPHYKIDGYYFVAVVSDGHLWEHVSVSLGSKKREVDRCPTWEEMCYVKKLFWSDDQAVMQLHVPSKEHVNQHNYCLHLWRPLDWEIILPPSYLVGIK